MSVLTFLKDEILHPYRGRTVRIFDVLVIQLVIQLITCFIHPHLPFLFILTATMLLFFVGCLIRSTYVRTDATWSKHRGLNSGFRRYMHKCFCEYLSQDRIEQFIEILEQIKDRKGNEGIEDGHLIAITDATELRSVFYQSKVLKKYDLYSFAHNMTMYLNITRKEAAILLKTVFPGLFSGVNIKSMDKSLTAQKDKDKLKITYYETPEQFEMMLLGYNDLDNNN